MAEHGYFLAFACRDHHCSCCGRLFAYGYTNINPYLLWRQSCPPRIIWALAGGLRKCNARSYRTPCTVLINLSSVRPSLSKEERNAILLHDLGVQRGCTDVFTMLLTQLLCVSLAAADPCQAILAKLQAGVTWTTAEGGAQVGCGIAQWLARWTVEVQSRVRFSPGNC
jgi:hypothetical protein